MNFLQYIFDNSKDNKKASLLFIVFVLFYISINFTIVHFVSTTDMKESPFNVPFKLNIFNFDPSIYYINPSVSIIHPFIIFLTRPLTFIATYTFQNYFFLIIQSILNSLCVCMIYFYLRKSGGRNGISLLGSSIFGTSSYLIFTSFVPDSYPYAQFVIILSILYLKYSRTMKTLNIRTTTLLGLANFGITSTNILPFAGALLLNKSVKNNRHFLLKLLFVLILFVFLFVIAYFIQIFFIGTNAWLTTWRSSLDSGGFSYTADFSLNEHWIAFYYLVSSPIMTPHLVLLDSNLMAIVTDITNAFTTYKVVPALILLFAMVGFMVNIRSIEVWVLMVYPLFAFVLHIIVGFGLGAIAYDLYLYAGHYLFAIFLLAALFIININNRFLQTILTCIFSIFGFITTINNILKHSEVLEFLQSIFL